MDPRQAAAGEPAATTFVEELAAPARPPRPSLLQEILRQTSAGRDERPSAAPRPASTQLKNFLREPSFERALSVWLNLDPTTPAIPSRGEITRILSRDVARIDGLVQAQLNAILHHPTFQKLEASWRGLEHLVGKRPDGDGVQIRVLNIPWEEVCQDLSRALEFDQSQLFKKVYENEFGQPGGQPFGVLLGDYEMRLRPDPEHPTDDLEALGHLSSISAAAFAPFIASVHPSFFGIDSYTELERPINLARAFEQIDYHRWRRLRESPDSRFLGLTLPRMLMRLPHGTPGAPGARANFQEDLSGSDREGYLWGNAVYAFGGVLIRAFENSGWLADIRGIRHAQETRNGPRVCLDDGGLVSGLPAHAFSTDAAGVAVKCSTEVIITDSREKELEDLGFIPLCHCQDTEYSAFYGNQSIQKPTKYDDPKATANARLSSMLQYILCVSRFAHYVKVLSRDRVGSMIRPEDVQEELQAWLQKYTISNDSAGPEVKAKYPLREARVVVREASGAPGSYLCEIHLRPHFQLDQMTTAMKFTTELAQARTN